jgi:hypothetical protein
MLDLKSQCEEAYFIPILKDGQFKALEMVSYLFSALAFSFSSHALIRAHLFSASTLASTASDK